MNNGIDGIQIQAALRRLQRLAESVETAEPSEVGTGGSSTGGQKKRVLFCSVEIPWKNHGETMDKPWKVPKWSQRNHVFFHGNHDFLQRIVYKL